MLKAVKISFNNNRHVMIVGDEGTGKSQIAKYIAEYRDKIYCKDKNEDGICYCECTEELKCSDLIGKQYPSLNSSKDNSQQLMRWEDGFLTLSINIEYAFPNPQLMSSAVSEVPCVNLA